MNWPWCTAVFQGTIPLIKFLKTPWDFALKGPWMSLNLMSKWLWTLSKYRYILILTKHTFCKHLVWHKQGLNPKLPTWNVSDPYTQLSPPEPQGLDWISNNTYTGVKSNCTWFREVGWLVVCWSFTSGQHLKSYQDGYWPMTACTHANFAVLPTGRQGHQHNDYISHTGHIILTLSQPVPVLAQFY